MSAIFKIFMIRCVVRNDDAAIKLLADYSTNRIVGYVRIKLLCDTVAPNLGIFEFLSTFIIFNAYKTKKKKKCFKLR